MVPISQIKGIFRILFCVLLCLAGCKPNTKNTSTVQSSPTIVVSAQTSKETKLPSISEGLELEDVTQSEEDGTRYVLGTVSSHRDTALRRVKIQIDLLDKLGNKIGSTNFTIEKMQPATRRSFKAVIEPREAEGFSVKSVIGE